MSDQGSPELELKSHALLGKGGELNKFARKNPQEKMVIFSQLKNKVLSVNPHINFPFNLKEGEHCALGLFAEDTFKEEAVSAPPGKIALETQQGHGRAALLGRVVFSDDDGNLYRDIDIKGIGWVDYALGDPRVMVRSPESPGIEFVGGRAGAVAGLLDREIAEYDREMAEYLHAAGIRASRTIAIIGLEELIFQGRPISLEEANKRGLLNDIFEPVIEVRAFGTKYRLSDLDPQKKDFRLILDDAKAIVAEEMGRSEELSDEEYLTWFAKTLGRSLGNMHKAGLSSHAHAGKDTTLDSRFVDLDDIESLETESQQVGDFSEGYNTVVGLADVVKGTDSPIFWESKTQMTLKERIRESRYGKLFRGSYNEVFPLQQRKEYFTKIRGMT